MIEFEIAINGTRYGEDEEITAVTIVAEEVGAGRSERVSIHGQGSDGRLQWLDSHLSIGDEIRVRIVEVSETQRGVPEGCSYCAREIQVIHRLIQGNSVAICDECSKRFGESLKSSTALPIGASMHDDPDQACGFCGRDARDAGGVIVRNGAAICGQCVRTCEELFADE